MCPGGRWVSAQQSLSQRLREDSIVSQLTHFHKLADIELERMTLERCISVLHAWGSVNAVTLFTAGADDGLFHKRTHPTGE